METNKTIQDILNEINNKFKKFIFEPRTHTFKYIDEHGSLKPMAKAIKEGTYQQTILKAPFMNYSKTMIVEIGKELSVPFEKTWSCYVGEERPCLKCGTCVERTEAFYLNGLKDPALTDKEWKKAINYLEKFKKEIKEEK